MKFISLNKVKAITGGCPGISQIYSTQFQKDIQNRDMILTNKRPLIHRLDDKNSL